VREWLLTRGPDAAYVAAMEDVLDVYARAFDPARPLVCFDESGKELQAQARPAQPPRPGRPAREDSEYVRGGSANLFLWTAPLLGRRDVVVTARRTAIDFAHAMRRLVDEDFPDAEKIVLVLDNLNTHRPAALYAAFPPAEAKRIWDKLEFHFTPIHGSWLNIAESEYSALKRQCLDRRLPDQATLAHETAAWVAERNERQITIEWRFTTADARIKLKQLYPIVDHDK
jgi:DDE superfamily endonuclease